MLAQGLNSPPNGIPKANSNLRKIQRNEVIAELAHNILPSQLPGTKLSPMRIGLMLRKHGVRLRVHQIPKFVFHEFIRC